MADFNSCDQTIVNRTGHDKSGYLKTAGNLKKLSLTLIRGVLFDRNCHRVR